MGAGAEGADGAVTRSNSRHGGHDDDTTATIPRGEEELNQSARTCSRLILPRPLCNEAYASAVGTARCIY